MPTVDELKLQRDGQLAFGRPSNVVESIRACEAMRHPFDHIEYAGGLLRCGGCLQFFRPTLSDLRSTSTEDKA